MSKPHPFPLRSPDESSERRARAEARRRRGMTVERITSFDDPVVPLEGTPESWLALTTELTRAAFRLSGRPLVDLPRSAWPGEVFWIDDADERRPA